MYSDGIMKGQKSRCMLVGLVSNYDVFEISSKVSLVFGILLFSLLRRIRWRKLLRNDCNDLEYGDNSSNLRDLRLV